MLSTSIYSTEAEWIRRHSSSTTSQQHGLLFGLWTHSGSTVIQLVQDDISLLQPDEEKDRQLLRAMERELLVKCVGLWFAHPTSAIDKLASNCSLKISQRLKGQKAVLLWYDIAKRQFSYWLCPTDTSLDETFYILPGCNPIRELPGISPIRERFNSVLPILTSFSPDRSIDKTRNEVVRHWHADTSTKKYWYMNDDNTVKVQEFVEELKRKGFDVSYKQEDNEDCCLQVIFEDKTDMQVFGVIGLPARFTRDQKASLCLQFAHSSTPEPYWKQEMKLPLLKKGGKTSAEKIVDIITRNRGKKCSKVSPETGNQGTCSPV